MIQIGDAIISLDVIERKFCCDLSAHFVGVGIGRNVERFNALGDAAVVRENVLGTLLQSPCERGMSDNEQICGHNGRSKESEEAEV